MRKTDMEQSNRGSKNCEIKEASCLSLNPTMSEAEYADETVSGQVKAEIGHLEKLRRNRLQNVDTWTSYPETSHEYIYKTGQQHNMKRDLQARGCCVTAHQVHEDKVSNSENKHIACEAKGKTYDTETDSSETTSEYFCNTRQQHRKTNAARQVGDDAVSMSNSEELENKLIVCEAEEKVCDSTESASTLLKAKTPYLEEQRRKRLNNVDTVTDSSEASHEYFYNRKHKNVKSNLQTRVLSTTRSHDCTEVLVNAVVEKERIIKQREREATDLKMELLRKESVERAYKEGKREGAQEWREKCQKQEEKVALLRDKLQQVKVKSVNMQVAMQQNSDETLRIKEEKLDLEIKLEEERAKNVNMKAEIEKNNDKMRRLEEKEHELEMKLEYEKENMQAAMQRNDIEMQRMKDKEHDLEMKLEEEKAKNVDMKAEIEKNNDKMRRLEEKEHELEMKVKQQDAAFESVKRRNRNLQKFNEDLVTKVSELEDQVMQQRVELNSSRRHKEDCQHTVHHLITRLETLLEQDQNNRVVHDQLRDMIDGLREHDLNPEANDVTALI